MNASNILVAGATGRVEELASMFALFEVAGYASDSPALRETFGVEALTIEEWARRVSRSRTSG